MRKNYSTEGDKIFYVCSFSNDCTCAAYILCHNDSLKVSLFKSDDEHNHELTSTVGIDPRVKEKIQSLYENGVIKPNLIIRALNSSDLPRFNKGQLSNYLRQLKNSIYGPYTISLNSINENITNNSVLPENWNKVYIAGSDCHINPPNDEISATIRLFFTTKRLLSLTSNTKHIATDATYKLVWQGYPVLMIGTTDRGCHYHPFGLAVCTKEEDSDFNFVFSTLKSVVPDFAPTEIIADASGAITNGFTQVYGGPNRRIMCWIHMQRNIKKYLIGIPSKLQTKIISDIHHIQHSVSSQVFEASNLLFYDKWMDRSPAINTFINYYRRQ